jgi:predicted dehydrogenase
MARLRVGVLGAGDVAQGIYLPGIARLSRQGAIGLAAVCDAVESRAANAAAAHEIPQWFTSYDEMLDSGAIDAVVNLTPMQFHAEATLKALAAGKHVYTEKPIATTIGDADRIIAAASEARLTLACAPALMTHPESQEVKQIIADGVIGKVCYVRARGSHPGPAELLDFVSDPTWFYQEGAGPIFDLGVYPLTFITGILGPAKRVVALSGIAIPRREIRAGVARGKTIDVGIDDNTMITLDFGEACFAQVDASFCVFSSKGPRAEIYGSEGAINLAATANEPPYEVFRTEPASGLRGWLTPERVYRGRLMTPVQNRDAADPWNFAHGVAHFARVIEGGEKLIMTPEHARHVLESMLKCYVSAREGRTLDLETRF